MTVGDAELTNQTVDMQASQLCCEDGKSLLDSKVKSISRKLFLPQGHRLYKRAGIPNIPSGSKVCRPLLPNSTLKGPGNSFDGPEGSRIVAEID